MVSTVLKGTDFLASANLYRGDKRGLGSIIRGIAIDNATNRVRTAQVAAVTDNSTGTAGSYANAPLQATPFDASGAATGAQIAAFNAALVKIENAGKTLVTSMNKTRALLDRPTMAAATGTNTADTVAALDKTVAGAQGTAAIGYASGKASMIAARNNVYRLVRAVNHLAVAVGVAPLNDKVFTGGNMPSDLSLLAIPAAVAATGSGTQTISKAAADAFFTAIANDIAAVTAKLNAVTDFSGTVRPVNVVAG